MINYYNHPIIRFLKSIGVHEIKTVTENQFHPHTISEKTRTTHFVILGNDSHIELLEKEGYEEMRVANLLNACCYEKEYAVNKMRIWLCDNKETYECLLNFVEHYIYTKYSLTSI